MYDETQRQKVIDIIFKEMTKGRSLRQICSRKDMPDKATVLRWLADSSEYATIIAHAREAQIEHYIDLVFEKAENCGLTTEEIAKTKLEIDTIKWVASKLKPKKYGDKIALEHNGKLELPVINVNYNKSDTKTIEGEIIEENSKNPDPYK